MRAMKAAAVLVVVALARPATAEDLTTTAERTGYARTGRYDEVQRLCQGYAAAYPQRARCFSFGETPEGRPMLALAVSDDGVLDPAAARARRRPVVLFQGGIHAGEIDGKDAGFAALRALLEARRPGVLGWVTALFVPVLNVDGHERTAAHRRPAQRGPEELGTRTTAQALNINRDWTKTEAPETAAILGLLAAWDPTLFVDLHDTDGARFEHDVSVLVAPEAPGGEPLPRAARALSDALMAGLTRAGHLPVPFYPALRSDDDPTSGFDAAPLSARYSHTYLGTRNRLGVLVEVHSWKPYAQRVQATRDVLALLFEQAAAHAPAWRKTEEAADAVSLAGAEVPLTFETVAPPRTIEFRGYAYSRAPSEISGVPWITYHDDRPQIWRVPLYDRLSPAVVVRAPRAGYLVPPAHAAWVAHKLELHGLRYQRLAAATAPIGVQAFRASAVSYASAPFEGRFTARVRGAWQPERHPVAAGSLYVPIAQPGARLLLQLLEPTGPDSLVSWGFFHGIFEEKEPMESYVIEEQARAMLASDPRLREEFAARLRADAAFAASPRQRLDFFRRRHPSWDDRVGLYPILRVDTPPVTARR
jgi:hypothetical protein